ncbi:MAG: alpha/beta hydrolase [Sedimenticolaceae bacterium]|jgi:esterase/lipase superfamily enzyme
MALFLASALAGCQPKVYLMPTPVALTTGEFDVFDGIALADQDTRLPVLYATNRVPLSTADARVYSIFASDELRLGVASLRIGDDSLDWEGLRALSMRATNERRPLLVSESVEELATLDSDAADGTLSKTAEEYFRRVNEALAESADKDLMVYVHGANANVYRATAQAAQYRHFTGRKSVVLAFAWPSAGSLFKYGTDVAHAAKTAPLFASFLELLARHTDAKNINILAYSAGAQVASPALALLGAKMAAEPLAGAREKLRLGEVYFAAPDVNFKDFVDHLRRYVMLTRNVTISINLNDDVLALAQFHHKQSRAGRPDPSELSEDETLWLMEATKRPNFDVINIDPESMPDLWEGSHSFWYDHPWVSTDVLIQFRGHARPAERGLVEGKTPGGGQYWSFSPDYDSRIIELLKQAKGS